MKLLFGIILAFLAVQGTTSAQLPQFHTDIQPLLSSFNTRLLESLRGIVNELIDRAVRLYNDIAARLDALLTDIAAKLEQLSVESQLIVERYGQEIQLQIDQYGPHTTSCFQAQRDEVNKIVAEANIKIKECVTKAMQDVESSHQQIVQIQEVNRQEISKLRAIFSTCNNSSPIQTITCIIDNVTLMNESLKTMGLTAKNAIQVAAAQVGSRTGDARTCIANVIRDTRSKCGDKSLEISKCVEEQNQQNNSARKQTF